MCFEQKKKKIEINPLIYLQKNYRLNKPEKKFIFYSRDISFFSTRP